MEDREEQLTERAPLVPTLIIAFLRVLGETTGSLGVGALRVPKKSCLYPGVDSRSS